MKTNRQKICEAIIYAGGGFIIAGAILAIIAWFKQDTVANWESLIIVGMGLKCIGFLIIIPTIAADIAYPPAPKVTLIVEEAEKVVIPEEADEVKECNNDGENVAQYRPFT